LRLLIITSDTQKHAGLCKSLDLQGFACGILSYDDALTNMTRQSPDIVVIEIEDRQAVVQAEDIIKLLKRDRRIPVLSAVLLENLDILDNGLDIDDFIVTPFEVRELSLRIKRLAAGIGKPDSEDTIECDGLVLDMATCEVAVDGRIVPLTFKEYELLKLLAGHRGRVYTREALLNTVWGYDYFGGDRTVDVHVRRLRSKIEDAKHNYIETVRNIGYRFKKES